MGFNKNDIKNFDEGRREEEEEAARGMTPLAGPSTGGPTTVAASTRGGRVDHKPGSRPAKEKRKRAAHALSPKAEGGSDADSDESARKRSAATKDVGEGSGADSDVSIVSVVSI